MMSQQHFNFGLQKSEDQHQNTDVNQITAPTASPLPFSMAPLNFNGAMAHSEPIKRKRGRPKKNGVIGVTTPTLHCAPSTALSPSTDQPKRRGRPRGSLNKPRHVTQPSPVVPFTPHIITVKAGECLATKIVAISLDVRSNVCILSANGTISRVTLRQPSSGSVTYEGRFEILTLSGSLLVYDNNGLSNRSGGLNVSLSGPDGHVVGGGVSGELIAASAVQVVVLSFPGQYCNVSNLANQMGNSAAQPKFATAGQSSSPSRGTLSESSGGPDSPHNPSS